MPTRADFWIGRDPDTMEWLGSVTYDGYPDGVFDNDLLGLGRYGSDDPDHWLKGLREWLHNHQVGERSVWRALVTRILNARGDRDATYPHQGYPWPWADGPELTDYHYTFDAGDIWFTRLLDDGKHWGRLIDGDPRKDDGDPEPKESDGPAARFPDMADRANAPALGSKRSGVIAFGLGPEVLDPENER